MEKLKKVLDRIFIDGLSGMAQGLFATLIIGTIVQQIGTLIGGSVGDMIFAIGKVAASLTGAGTGGYEEAELIGLCTDICVVSNALLIKAVSPELPVAVSKNCCAGVTVKTHEAAIQTMEMCQIEIR